MPESFPDLSPSRPLLPSLTNLPADPPPPLHAGSLKVFQDRAELEEVVDIWCDSWAPPEVHDVREEYGYIRYWDVSLVTDFKGLMSPHYVNGEYSNYGRSDMRTCGGLYIEDWNTGAVTDMSYMFHDNEDFNKDISDWDTSAVTNMQAMFHSAEDFDQDLSKWDISSVTGMGSMFKGAEAFSQQLCWELDDDVDRENMFLDTNGGMLVDPDDPACESSRDASRSPVGTRAPHRSQPSHL